MAYGSGHGDPTGPVAGPPQIMGHPRPQPGFGSGAESLREAAARHGLAVAFLAFLIGLPGQRPDSARTVAREAVSMIDANSVQRFVAIPGTSFYHSDINVAKSESIIAWLAPIKRSWTI